MPVIIFCDDTPETTLDYCLALEGLGYQLIKVLSAVQAYDAIVQRLGSDLPVDAVVLDVDSPEDALPAELAQYLEELRRPANADFLALGLWLMKKEVPFLFLTAVPDILRPYSEYFTKIPVADKLRTSEEVLCRKVAELLAG